jgi:hypothetical protein
MTRDGSAVVKVNYLCGSHPHIGSIYTVQVLFGFPANVELVLIFLISYMDAVGLLAAVLVPRYQYYDNRRFMDYRYKDTKIAQCCLSVMTLSRIVS